MSLAVEKSSTAAAAMVAKVSVPRTSGTGRNDGSGGGGGVSGGVVVAASDTLAKVSVTVAVAVEVALVWQVVAAAEKWRLRLRRWKQLWQV